MSWNDPNLTWNSQTADWTGQPLGPPPVGAPKFDHAWRTPSWQRVQELHATWQEVRDTYPTWQDLRETGVMPLPDATLESFYRVRLRVTGGAPPFHFQLVGGYLPAGLALDPDSGEVTGVPTGGAEVETIFVARVTDSENRTGRDGPFMLVVRAPVVLLPSPPPPPPPPPDILWLAPTNGGNGKLVLTTAVGGPMLDIVHWTEVDYGYPEVREVSDDRPQAHGAVDRTRFFGPRVVTLTGKVAVDWRARGRRQQAMDALAPYLEPGARSWLYSRFDDGRVRRMLIRADQFTRPQIADVQDIGVTFKSPTGVLEDADESLLRLAPAAPRQGRTYPRTYPRRYPPGGGGAWLAVNRGNVPAEWLARIFGPCLNPALVNVDTGARIAFDLELAAGEFLEISTREHTALLDGEASVWHALDYVASDWWTLPPGGTRVRFEVDTWQPPAVAWLHWRNSNLI